MSSSLFHSGIVSDLYNKLAFYSSKKVSGFCAVSVRHKSFLVELRVRNTADLHTGGIQSSHHSEKNNACI